jgi:hypothetical protein
VWNEASNGSINNQSVLVRVFVSASVHARAVLPIGSDWGLRASSVVFQILVFVECFSLFYIKSY